MTDAVVLTKMGTLDELLELQRKLMSRLGLPTSPVSSLDSPLLLEGLVMLAGEVAEALDPLLVRSKPWKVVDRDKQRAQVEEEVIDAFFFWLEVATLLGWDEAEVRRRYRDKWERNLQRLPVGTAEVAAVVPVISKSQPVEHPAISLVKLPWWQEYETHYLFVQTERLAGKFNDVTVRYEAWKVVWDVQDLLAGNLERPARDLLDKFWDKVWPGLDGADRQLVQVEFPSTAWDEHGSPST